MYGWNWLVRIHNRSHQSTCHAAPNSFPALLCMIYTVNTLRPIQNGRYFADDIFKCIFLNENAWISLKISLKFVPKVRIYNIPALVQIMAWCRPGDKPLSEPMMVSLLTHICVTRPQWVNDTISYNMTNWLKRFVLNSLFLHCDIYCLQPSNSYTYLGQIMVAELLVIYVLLTFRKKISNKMVFLISHMLSYRKFDRFYGKCNLSLWKNWKCHMNKCELIWNQT